MSAAKQHRERAKRYGIAAGVLAEATVAEFEPNDFADYAEWLEERCAEAAEDARMAEMAEAASKPPQAKCCQCDMMWLQLMAEGGVRCGQCGLVWEVDWCDSSPTAAQG